ncbi:MAG: hypothetical protein AAGA69_09915 [Pseudomonadota bacterium]
MLNLDGSCPTPTPFASTVSVRLPRKPDNPSVSLLDASDSATVRAFATRAQRRTTEVYETVTDRPSYRQMQAQPTLMDRISGLLSGRKMAAGMSLAALAMVTTACTAGAMTHWVLNI